MWGLFTRTASRSFIYAFGTFWNHAMQILIVGTGKLARELLGSLNIGDGDELLPWADRNLDAAPAIVVHAGSGREIAAVMDYCSARHAPLLELATGSALESITPAFPLILCPNTNILMLKFMSMLEKSAALFRNERITLTESHQAQKTSAPGTALRMAQALGLPEGALHSVRDAARQRSEFHIPAEHLARHAFHQIVIEDSSCSLKFETRVYGDSPYADGVAKILAAVSRHDLEDRGYSIMEFIDRGWL